MVTPLRLIEVLDDDARLRSGGKNKTVLLTKSAPFGRVKIGERFFKNRRKVLKINP